MSSAAAANAVPVAEFTFAAIVMIAKDVFRIRDRHREVRGREAVDAASGRRASSAPADLRVGVIGASATGRLVITRLRSLEVSIAVSDPYLDDDGVRTMGATLMELDDLFSWADIVTVHAPALPSTASPGERRTSGSHARRRMAAQHRTRRRSSTPTR